MLDTFYISIYNHYKKPLGRKSLKLALLYINILELGVYLAIASFFMAFASKMKIDVMSKTKFWILFGVISGFVIFKNWMRYNGKKRTMLNSKHKPKTQNYSIVILLGLPFGLIFLGIILLQVP